MTDAFARLYERPLAAGRHGPLYNAFSYPTKISAETIAVFIACHTKPGERVLDVFGGSGTTGVATLLCERPTDRMLKLAAEAGLDPVWGPRNATIYELSEIGGLLGRVMTAPPDPTEFRQAAEALLQASKDCDPDLYLTTGPEGEPGEVRHVIWSDVVTCPRCGVDITYADLKVRLAPLRFDSRSTCAACQYEGAADEWVRVTEEVTDPWTSQALTRRVRVPWKVYGKSKAGNWSRPATSADTVVESASLAKPLPPGAPIAEVRWGDLYRSGYHQGMTHLHHLYTGRNFRALATLWALIDAQPPAMRDPLRLLVLSYNASHSTLMTRVVLKKNSSDFVLTGAQSGVLYVSGLPVEKNIFTGVHRKIGVFQRAFEMLHGTHGRVDVITGSSTQIALPDESIDYVFTDPPFGAYIPYSEINQINELWLGRSTDRTSEAIVSPAQGKGLAEYQQLLTDVFTETARVMRPHANATVVFHSAHASVWQALSASLSDAGLRVAAASILDKTQASFKQVNGDVAVSGDPLLRVTKVMGGDDLDGHVAVDRNHTGHDGKQSKRAREHAYSQMVGQSLVDGLPVTVNAKDFYITQAAGSAR